MEVNESKIVLDKVYRMAVPDYLALGKDGFGCLLHTHRLIDLIVAPNLKDLISQFLSKFL